MKPQPAEILVLCLVSIASTLITYYFNNKRGWGPVKSSALFSLAVGLFIHFSPVIISAYLTTKIPLVFFGASFTGMVSDKVIKSYKVLAMSGFFFMIIYLNINSVFSGFGGGLGTSACIAVLSGIGLNALLTFLSEMFKKINNKETFLSGFKFFYKPKR